MIRSIFNFALAMGIVMLTMGLLTGASQAQYAQNCSDRASMVRTLEDTYGEVRLGGGLREKTVMELWFSQETGTWTIMESYPNGRACVMAVGEDWALDVLPVPGSPA